LKKDVRRAKFSALLITKQALSNYPTLRGGGGGQESHLGKNIKKGKKIKIKTEKSMLKDINIFKRSKIKGKKVAKE
jgi:hypothetical protein